MTKRKHTVEIVTTELEIEENLDLHEKGWKIQKVSLIFIYLLVILAAIGFFGNGVVSKRKLSEGNSQVEFDRFHRREARMNIKFGLNSDSNSTISFSNNYLEKIKVESVLPEPKEVKIANDRVIYFFDATGQSNIIFYLVPQEMGTINGSVLVNSNQFNLTHFIYP